MRTLSALIKGDLMYSPTTRLLTLLELLQSYKQMSGSEMARRLEVDARTVRRYIVMLQDMGIPVEAERGPYGAYQLRRGYKLPPLMFTDAEAVALTLSLLAIRKFNFPLDVAAIEGALAKTERVLPEKLLGQVRALQEAITFQMSPRPLLSENHYVMTLSSAVQAREPVFLRYQAYEGGETERVFDPYGIVFYEGYWYTSGYCHLRQDLRTFRLDRVMALEAREGAFERPDDFDTLTHVLESLGPTEAADKVEILLRTTLDHAREAIDWDIATFEATDDGVVLRCATRNLDWLAFTLLNLDFPMHVRQPAALRDKLGQIGAKALGMVE
jgi:predicted DNA-binding transcriptional regulator YafY